LGDQEEAAAADTLLVNGVHSCAENSQETLKEKKNAESRREEMRLSGLGQMLFPGLLF